jgi:hypothetical protein
MFSPWLVTMVLFWVLGPCALHGAKTKNNANIKASAA